MTWCYLARVNQNEKGKQQMQNKVFEKFIAFAARAMAADQQVLANGLGVGIEAVRAMTLDEYEAAWERLRRSRGFDGSGESQSTASTSGPWEQHGLTIYTRPVWKDGHKTEYVIATAYAECNPLPDEDGEGAHYLSYEAAAANARLIASAPNLLAALRGLLERLEAMGCDDPESYLADAIDSGTLAAIDATRAAIAKAEGNL